MSSLTSRFYLDKFPKTDDVVMVTVRAIAEMGAYVQLLEYDNIEGMILLSELSRRRIRSINKLIRIGKTEPVVVIRVDENKGYIDLSKRRVSPDDVDSCTDRYSKAKSINSLLRHVGTLLGYKSSAQLERLYEQTAWHFERKYGDRTIAYDFFKRALVEPAVLDECNLDDETKAVLLQNIRAKLVLPTVKIRADIECSCYGYEGIDAVKAALRKGLEVSTEDLAVRINLIAPPLYVVTTTTVKRAEGVKVLEAALAAIKAAITEAGGQFKEIMAPKLVTSNDEVDLARRLERAEAENAEVNGDDDDEEEASLQAREDADDIAAIPPRRRRDSDNDASSNDGDN